MFYFAVHPGSLYKIKKLLTFCANSENVKIPVDNSYSRDNFFLYICICTTLSPRYHGTTYLLRFSLHITWWPNFSANTLLHFILCVFKFLLPLYFILIGVLEINTKNNSYILPSASTSFIMSCNSASVGFWPSDLMTVPNSFVVIVPSPSLSNNENASLNSAICSSVNWSALKY